METLPITEEYEKSSITFRGLRSDDFEKWYDFTKSCSSETLYQRYNEIVSFDQKDAKQSCLLKNDVALVAIVNGKIIGEVRLFLFGENNQYAEFAILVADKWQGNGIGSKLAYYSLCLARSIGIRKIIACTGNYNYKMIAIFKKLGFDSQRYHNTISLEKKLELIEVN